jgi:peptidoglycan/LPS O-acetylase OafA/YrhL
MGLLRFFLALSVAVWHFGTPGAATMLINGYVAVISFFVISGFYMSMVINESYAVGPGWIRRFYASRFLRLYPLYWAVVALTILYWRSVGVPFTSLLNLDLPLSVFARSGLVLSNLGIFGLDLAALDRAVFTEDPIMRLVGPAWSLAIELQFYLMAPFLVTRSLRFCFAVLTASLLLRVSLLGLHYDPWRYLFGPADWCFFILGHVAHRLSLLMRDKAIKIRLGICCAVLLPLVGYAARVQAIQDLDRPRLWVYYICFAASVPFIFELTRKAGWDRTIGNVSYPIYLVHPLIFTIFLASLGASPQLYNVFGGLYRYGLSWCLAALGCVIIAAYALHFGIERPIDRIRARFRRSGSSPIGLPSDAAVRAATGR